MTNQRKSQSKERSPGRTRGEQNIKWIEKHCRIPEGKFVGKPVKLTKQQKKWIKQIYDSPTRTFILSMARKNAKTALSAFLLLLHTCGPEARPNSQLYSAAQSRDQAAILFSLAAKVVRMSPELSEFVVIRDTAKQIFCPELGTLYRALSAEATTAFGLSPVFVVHDELGQVIGPNFQLYDALETACAAQDEPLSIIISTQAPNDGDLLSVLIDDAIAGHDPTTKCVLYTADEELDPFSEESIRQANPHFDDFMNQNEVFKIAEKARRMPSRESSYRNLILNQRVSQVSPFIPKRIWSACAGEIPEEALIEGDVYAGLDLSARHDLTALAIAAHYDDRWYARVEFFAPQNHVKERTMRDRVPYDLWAKQGWINLTPGASVDYDLAAMRLVELHEQYDILNVGFDRWRIDVMEAALSRLGVELPLSPFGQGYKDMSPALDAVEAELMNERLIHENNPVLNWCAQNSIVVQDPAGNRKLDKSKSTGRIDGMIALVMAIAKGTTQINESDSIYNQRDLIVL